MRTLSMFVLLSAFAPSATAKFEPPLFAFQNGVAFGPVENEAKTLKELGYDGIGSASPRGLSQRLEAYDKVGLKVFSIYVDVDTKGLPEAIEKLKERGATVELTVRRKIDEGVVSRVREIAQLASKSKVRVALYPHTGFAVATIDSALDLIEKVDHPNLGVMFNLCHYLRNEKPVDLEATVKRAKGVLFAVSTCGADTDGRGWNTLIQPLDKGSFDQGRLFSTLKEIGFEGAVGLQCYAVRGDKKANLARSMTAWKKILAKLEK